MPTNPFHKSSGQAIVEFIMVIVTIVLLVSAAAELLPLFIKSLQQQSTAHSNAGKNSLNSSAGISMGYSDTYKTNLSLPFLLNKAKIRLSETLRFPAASIAIENSSPKYKSIDLYGRPESYKGYSPPFPGKWIQYGIKYENEEMHEYVYFFGDDTIAPSAVAVVYMGPAYTDPNKTTITAIASTVGGEL